MSRRSQNGRREIGSENTGAGSTEGIGTGITEGIGTAESGSEIRDTESGAGTGAEEGTEIGDGIFVDPGTAEGIEAGTDAGTGAPIKRKRGRPKGSGRKTSGQKAQAVSTSLDGIEGILLSLHMMGATILNIPELLITEKESAQLSEAIARVAAHYDLGASQKTIDWVNLAVCVGGMYGTRAYAYHLRVKTEEEQKRSKPANVLTFGN